MHSDLPGREKPKSKKDGETKRTRGRPPLPKGLKCEKCNTTDTPEWRVGENGPHTLCNACGLQYAKKKKVEIESKAKHSIKNILNENEPAAAAVAEAVQRGQQDFLIHNSTYGKVSGIPAYHANKNKRPSAIAIASPAGSPMLTRANNSGTSSPMAFAPSSPFNIPNYFSAMTLSSPTGTPTGTPPPPPFANGPSPSPAGSPAIPRMSPFNPASHSPTGSTPPLFPPFGTPFSDQQPITQQQLQQHMTATVFMAEGKISPTSALSPSPSAFMHPSEKLSHLETASVLSSFSPSHSPAPSPTPFMAMGGFQEKVGDRLGGAGLQLAVPGPYSIANNPIYSNNLIYNTNPPISKTDGLQPLKSFDGAQTLKNGSGGLHGSGNLQIPLSSKSTNSTPNYDNMDYL